MSFVRLILKISWWNLWFCKCQDGTLLGLCEVAGLAWSQSEAGFDWFYPKISIILDQDDFNVFEVGEFPSFSVSVEKVKSCRPMESLIRSWWQRMWSDTLNITGCLSSNIVWQAHSDNAVRETSRKTFDANLPGNDASKPTERRQLEHFYLCVVSNPSKIPWNIK